MSLFSFFALGKTAAAIPPPHPNPTGGQHWYHGTGHEFYDEDDDDRDPEVPKDPGGTLRTPYRHSDEYGAHSSEHWNTDLGVHFTSEADTAEAFATNKGKSYATRPHWDSRIAHAKLHIGNPKHYDSEFDMSRHAIEWAHENGYHYLTPGNRNSDQTDERVQHFSDSFSELPGEDESRLQHLDGHDSGTLMDHLMVDRGEHAVGHLGHRSFGHEMDRYLSEHPDREEITSGFKKHLEDQGHDGITYGNEYEEPHHHTCAVAFDDDHINLSHWQWLDPRKHHLNRNPDEGGHPEQPERLFDRNYTPEHGYHWADPEGHKIGLLFGHFASGTPLYKQPKPEHVSAPEGASDEEVSAHYDQQRQHRDRWQREVRRALSRGDLRPDEARANGYWGDGHDQDYNGGLTWKHLPHTLWHVTTNKSGVMASNTLKSRAELGQIGGHGLGGGPDDTISFTDDPEVARNIHQSLHEYHSVLTGKTSTRDLMDQAKREGLERHMVYSYGGPHPDDDWDGKHPQGLRDVIEGKRTKFGLAKADEMAEDGWHPHPDHPEEGPLPGHHLLWRKDASPEEALADRSEMFKRYAMWRGHTGGREDPGFIMNSPKDLAAIHPSQFAIVRVHPKPGSQGYQVSSLGEWRTVDGSAVHVAGLESPHSEQGLDKQAAKVAMPVIPERQGLCYQYAYQHLKDHPDATLVHGSINDGAVSHHAWVEHGDQVYEPTYDESFPKDFYERNARPQAEARYSRHEAMVAMLRHGHYGPWHEGYIEPREAKQGQEYLPNPYHDHDEWFHGTRHDFADKGETLDPARVLAEHNAPSKGMGGPQCNKLMGVHFTPLHSVAHGFADSVYESGRVFHARLKMKNPIHFADEHHLLRHLWNTTMRSDHFHDDEHDKNMQWAYSSGSTREGINSRLHRGASWSVHNAAEHHLQFHPQQKSIVEQYVNHLAYEGHDGITYGNNVEGPNLHHCAIAFHPDQIEITHIDHMHANGKDDEVERQRKYQWMPTVSNAHVRSIHGEPEAFLDEVNRYHNNGSTGRWGNQGINTGRGEWKFHQSAKEAGARGDLPEGLTFEHREPGYNSRSGNSHTLIAHHPDADFESGYENHVGHITWFWDDGEIGAIDVSEPYRRRGIASELFRRAKEIEPRLHHARTLTDDGKAWAQRLGALLPGYVHEHPWLPHQGVFMPTKGTLDPRLFGRDDLMRPEVEQVIFARLDLVLTEYPDWRKWARIALAGSEASMWWGGNDFDTMFGINYDRFRKAHPEDAALSGEEISAKINRIFGARFNDEDWVPPWDSEVWHLTCYSNPNAWDIRDIKPYAAFDLTHHRWVVKPPQVSTGAEAFPEETWDEAEGYLAVVDAIEKIKDPVDRARRGAMLYHQLHGDRRHAFTPAGQGWKDPSNTIFKFLQYHPTGPMEKLVGWAREDRANQAKVAA